MSLSSSSFASTTSSTSSFTTITSTSTSTTPNPTNPLPGVNDSGNSGSGQRGANYFFGFLITFVVLLLIFVGCGIGSRRRFLARRNAALFAGLDPWGAALRDGRAAQAPRMYELYVGSAKRVEDKWAETTPLSLTLLRQRVEGPLASPDTDLEAAAAALNANPSPSANANPTPNESAYARTLAALTVPFHERKQPLPADTGPPPAYSTPAALDVAVVIAMPAAQHARPYSYSYSQTHAPTLLHVQRRSPSPSSPPDADAGEEHAHSPRASSSASPARVDGAVALPEVQIGVATIPWNREVEGAEPPPGS